MSGAEPGPIALTPPIVRAIIRTRLDFGCAHPRGSPGGFPLCHVTRRAF
jgi:hypothetical protein